MMNDNRRKPSVLVLAADPGSAAEVLRWLNVEPLHVGSVAELMEHLCQTAVSGLVVELDSVAAATPDDRDRLFPVAARYPLLRARRTVGGLAFRDDPARFGQDVAAFAARRGRRHVRAAVRLNCVAARADDAEFMQAAETNILDISAGGAFVYTQEPYKTGESVRLRILELPSVEVVRADVRWRRRWGVQGELPGIGVEFVDPDARLAAEIRFRFVTTAAKQGGLSDDWTV